MATPAGQGGIAIVRISGDDAVEIAEKIFRPPIRGGTGAKEIGHGKIVYGNIVEPETGEVIDEVILCPMLAPNSYTREDVVEIQAHAGQAVVEKILGTVLGLGARLAEPGEFTKRAFLNGRIDLTRAEAVIDLIDAKTESARKIAGKQIQGELFSGLVEIKEKVLVFLAEIEAEIDFSEDSEDGFESGRDWEREILSPLERLRKGAEAGLVFKNGINVVLAGKPNVGKSSLMNRLLNSERAIVTPYPGTTRDHIEESFQLDGISARLYDTAGMRESNDPIEKIGIENARKILEKAHIVLFICDASGGMDRGDLEILGYIGDRPKIVVLNKADLVATMERPAIPEEWKGENVVETSALTGTGVEELKEAIKNQILGANQFEEKDILISNVRQKRHVTEAANSVERALAHYRGAYDLEIVSIELKEALKELDAVLGVEVGEDILDKIFNQFCIGK